MHSRCPTWMWGIAALVVAGCASRGDVEVLESELRRHEQQEQELAEQLQSVQNDLRVARSDADALRGQMQNRGQIALASEQAEVLYRADALKFNMLLTSGQNRDGQPGDEGLSVLLLPVDPQGDLVKLVGDVELELFDLAQQGDQQRVGQWSFNVDQVREHWHKGFLSAGYLFQLDWQNAPVSPELTLHARMVAPDGRRFDATTQVKITPPGASSSPVAQARYTTRRTSAAGMAPKAPDLMQAGHQEGPAAPAVMPRINPRPGHAPLQTSDRWTDSTIPHLR